MSTLLESEAEGNWCDGTSAVHRALGAQPRRGAVPDDGCNSGTNRVLSSASPTFNSMARARGLYFSNLSNNQNLEKGGIIRANEVRSELQVKACSTRPKQCSAASFCFSVAAQRTSDCGSWCAVVLTAHSAHSVVSCEGVRSAGNANTLENDTPISIVEPSAGSDNGRMDEYTSSLLNPAPRWAQMSPE